MLVSNIVSQNSCDVEIEKVSQNVTFYLGLGEFLLWAGASHNVFSVGPCATPIAILLDQLILAYSYFVPSKNEK